MRDIRGSIDIGRDQVYHIHIGTTRGGEGACPTRFMKQLLYRCIKQYALHDVFVY